MSISNQTISDQRSCITLQGKNPTEIHGALTEVCRDFTEDLVQFLVGLIVFVMAL